MYAVLSTKNSKYINNNNNFVFIYLKTFSGSQKKEGPHKRQLGRHPRIPFSNHQLNTLEEKFQQSPYLSSEEVTKLSQQLHLADIRVSLLLSIIIQFNLITL